MYWNNNKCMKINKKSLKIKVITKLPNSEQSYKGKVQTHNYINRQCAVNLQTQYDEGYMVYEAQDIHKSTTKLSDLCA
jgi:hypothetical protein